MTRRMVSPAAMPTWRTQAGKRYWPASDGIFDIAEDDFFEARVAGFAFADEMGAQSGNPDAELTQVPTPIQDTGAAQ